MEKQSSLSSVDSGSHAFDSPAVRLIERLNQIVATSLSLDALLLRVLGLAMSECQSRAGAIFILNPSSTELICRAARCAEDSLPELGEGSLASWHGKRLPLGRGPLFEAVSSRQPVRVERPSKNWRDEDLDVLSLAAQERVYCLPVVMPDRVVGVIQLVDPQALQSDWLNLIAGRIVTEIDKSLALEIAQQEIERKDHLISILGQIGATLDPDEVLRLLIEYGRQVINAEACSLFLIDEEQGDIVLHLSTNLDENPALGKVRVPRGKGLIGHVVETGERVLVSDVTHDQRHFRAVDQSTGFVTRAILTVPLRAASFSHGERGVIQERIIGGLQALNKLVGTFDEHDAEILTTLAQHAATVFRMAKAVADNNQLFMDMIQWMIAAIDARDPYTEGHSKRVSDFSVEIARQLNLSPELVYQVRIGSLLHDIGKIGVPDAILRKPGHLDETEYELMKQHPVIGARMMSQVHSLRHVLPALSEHHERLDGSGYPRGLKGDEISLFGRIVAVADVFDAMTSKRPYRNGASPEDALDYLYNRVHVEFDQTCVDALTRAYLSGKIKTQEERRMLGIE